jgi:lysophospholipase L1-like esterase
VSAELFLRLFFPLGKVNMESLPPLHYKLSGNSLLGYELRPNTRDTNAAGFRGRDYAVKKAPGVTRIVVLGDSIAYGIYIAAGDTYAARLENLLAGGRGSRYEVLNLGVNGYGTVQIAERFRELALRYDPDIVVYGYWFNDHTRYGCAGYQYPFFVNARARAWEAYASLASRFAVLRGLRGFALRSELFTRCTLAYYRLKAMRPVRENVSAVHAADYGPYADFKALIERAVAEGLDTSFLDGPVTPENFGEHWAALESMAKTCRERKIRFILMTTPIFTPTERYPYAGFHDFLRRSAATLGVEFLDVSRAVLAAQARDGGRFSFDKCHMNGKGHAAAAAALKKYLDGPGTAVNPWNKGSGTILP